MLRHMHPHGTQEYQVERQARSRDHAQCWQTIIDPVDGWVVMQGSGGSPHGRGRFDGDHIMTIGSQPSSITTAACAYVEH